MTLEILTPEKKFSAEKYMEYNFRASAACLKCLEKHAPLVSALKAGKLKILKDKNATSTYTIQSGFVEVLNNKTTVLVEGAKEN